MRTNPKSETGAPPESRRANETHPVTVPPPRPAVNLDQAEMITLLQEIVEALDSIDGSLANIGGKLDEIPGRMP